VFLTLALCTCHACPVAQKATSQELHTDGIFFVVRCVFLMVALQIPVPHSVKSRSIKRPSIRGVQTLVAFLCSRSFCRNSAPEPIRCSTLCPGIKGIKGSLYHKAVLRSMATSYDPLGHLQNLGFVVDDAAFPPLLGAPDWQGLKIGPECGSWGSWWLVSHGMCPTSIFTPVIAKS
jgi:hypothetical protein